MKIVSFLVKSIESRGIYISRDKTKYFGNFVNRVHSQILSQSQGVVHIGAHVGQEAPSYRAMNLDVIWIEADPQTFLKLEELIFPFSESQRCLNLLLGDKSDTGVTFYRASNSGQSSSIFKLGDLLTRDITLASTIKLNMVRLDEVLSVEDIEKHDHWVIDVQGAELLVLKGAGMLLERCKSLFVEVSLVEYYVGGARFLELVEFLEGFGFKPLWTPDTTFHGNMLFLRY